jgi:uncharacterized protein YecE (DUF72 family)
VLREHPENLFIGTSSWSSKDWCGSFYPETISPSEMIAVYAQKLGTVEIDATWHRMPTPTMVNAWKSRTPDSFLFSAKVPRVISHDKYLEDCESELKHFLSVMSPLGEKLGPLVLQFPYVAKGKNAEEYSTGSDFIARLTSFVPLLPKEFQWAVEIRNAKWLRPELLDVLRSNEISLVFIDYYTMDSLPKIAHRPDIFTAGFVYIRFLGNHRQMDGLVKKARREGKRSSDWGALLTDKTEQMKLWIPPIKKLVENGIPTYIYFNNHYAGYAPGSVELFAKLYNESG